MLNPLKIIWDAGSNLTEAAGTLAGKMPWPKDAGAKKKSKVGGVLGTVLGGAVLLAGMQIAAPALLLGAFVGWLGILPGLALELAAIGAAATGAAIFGAGMINGADKHCGIQTAILNKADRLMDRIENFFTRTRAPAVTDVLPAMKHAESRDAPALATVAKPAAQFAAATAGAPAASASAKPVQKPKGISYV